MPSGVKDIQLLELKDTISQLNKTISTQNELISSLQKMLEERNAKDSEKDLLIANLQSQLAYLKNKVFGSTSEIRHDQLDGQLNLFGTPVGDEKPAEVIEPEVISVKGYTKERKPKATYDDKYNSVRSICKHFFTDIVGLSIKFFCVSLRHMSILRGDITACDLLPRREAQIVENLISSNETADCDRELMTVSHIYNFTDRVCEKTLERKKQSKETFSSRADRILLNRFLAVPLFLSAVLLVFYLTFGSLGTRLGELADSFINGALSTALMSVLGSLGASEWVKDLVCGGILAGLGSVCSFLPQIALLFFFLGLLEDCGYMARGAFIADYPLRLLGLGGKSFLPLFMGFGCSVPALMSTRTLHAGREKKICAAVIPFMSCSAKMPVYAMLISTFFPNVRWLAVILVYSLGIACACAGSLILKKTVFKGVEPPFIFELPEYRLPRVRSALRYVRDRLREFLKKAGAVLFPASVIIWALGYFDFSFHHAADARLSMLGRIGGAVSFIFSPLGLGDWRCCVALISGLVARETTVSTLGILMGSAQSVRDIISPQAACAFMSFSLLSMPCVAAVAALRRELGTKSTAKVLIFEFITAWTVSFMIYRLALLI